MNRSLTALNVFNLKFVNSIQTVYQILDFQVKSLLKMLQKASILCSNPPQFGQDKLSASLSNKHLVQEANISSSSAFRPGWQLKKSALIYTFLFFFFQLKQAIHFFFTVFKKEILFYIFIDF